MLWRAAPTHCPPSSMDSAMMKVKRKYLDGRGHMGNREYAAVVYPMEGAFTSVVAVTSDKNPLVVELDGKPVCFADKGYQWVSYMPLEENWCVWCMYDNHGKVLEWYFDITKGNGVLEGEPCYDDLFLDVALFPDGKTMVLDRDELDQALTEGAITRDEYGLTLSVCDYILNELAVVPKMETLFAECGAVRNSY